MLTVHTGQPQYFAFLCIVGPSSGSSLSSTAPRDLLTLVSVMEATVRGRIGPPTLLTYNVAESFTAVVISLSNNILLKHFGMKGFHPSADLDPIIVGLYNGFNLKWTLPLMILSLATNFRLSHSGCSTADI